MFRKNDQHQQMPMFSSINSLPEKLQKRLEESWAGTFYREFFVRIDKEVFAVLYSDDAPVLTFRSTSSLDWKCSSQALAGATKRCMITKEYGISSEHIVSAVEGILQRVRRL